MNAPAPTETAPSAHCFIALLPDTAARSRLLGAQPTLQTSAAGNARGVRWIEPAALHLTLRFLGSSSADRIDDLKHMLPTLVSPLPVLATRRYGIWPNRARPRMLVLELEPEPPLLELADRCEQLARKAGFAPETRGFRAHITLARLRPGCAFGILPGPPPTIKFDAIALMQSTLAQPAATYRELARASLPAASQVRRAQ